MLRKYFLTLACFLTFCFSQSISKVPIQIEKLSDRIYNLRVGNFPGGGNTAVNNVTVIKTAEGAIIIDSGYFPFGGNKIKNIVYNEIGCDKILYLINTHSDQDHIAGNQGFDDIPIIAHKNIIPALEKFEQGLPEFFQQRRSRIDYWSRQIDSTDPGSLEHKTAVGWNSAHSLFLEEALQDFTITYPDLTFSDNLSLSLMDLEIEIKYLPPFHTDNDLIILIPEEKALVIGDIFFPDYLPMISDNYLESFTRFLSEVNKIHNELNDLTIIIPGHQSLMTRSDFLNRIEYLNELSEKIRGMVKGSSYEDIYNTLSTVDIFEKLQVKENQDNTEIHQQNIKLLYQLFAKK